MNINDYFQNIFLLNFWTNIRRSIITNYKFITIKQKIIKRCSDFYQSISYLLTYCNVFHQLLLKIIWWAKNKKRLFQYKRLGQKIYFMKKVGCSYIVLYHCIGKLLEYININKKYVIKKRLFKGFYSEINTNINILSFSITSLSSVN